MNKRKWLNLGIFVGLIIIAITIQKSRDFSKLPELEDYKIDLSYFQGRIFSKERIESGTFAIKQFDFEEIRNWGKDAIMTFDFYYLDGNKRVLDGNKREIVLKVWRPDSETDNVFQYFEKVFKTSHIITSLKQEGNVIYAKQTREVGWVLIVLGLLSTSSAGLIVASVLYFCNKKKITSYS